MGIIHRKSRTRDIRRSVGVGLPHGRKFGYAYEVAKKKWCDCPKCGVKIHLPDDIQNCKEVRCPECKARVEISMKNLKTMTHG